MKTEIEVKDEIAEALTTFIKSGSANGNEDMRRKCLKLVPVFAAAPDLLAALEAYVEWRKPEGKTSQLRVNYDRAVAAISKVKGAQ